MNRTAAVVLCLLSVACVQRLDPLFIDETLSERLPARITLLPVVDARVSKLDHVLLVRDVNEAARRLLAAKGYELKLQESFLGVGLRNADLAELSKVDLCEVVPREAGVFLAVFVEAVEAEDGVDGRGLRVVLSGILADRNDCSLLWRDRTVGNNELGGLMSVFSLASVRHEAAANAIRNLLSTLPSRADGH